MTNTVYEQAETAAEFIRTRVGRALGQAIDAAVVLGSGLGAFADTLTDAIHFPYSEIPGFPVSTVEGHSGRLVVGQLPNTSKTIAAMQGRFHFYEGYEMAQVTLPMRTFGVLGIKKLILTNAAGGVNPAFKQGSLMLIRDHINLMPMNPLRGKNDVRFGPRFPDMTEVYSRRGGELALRCAKAMGLELKEGVYLALQGPNYETPAEVRMARLLGGDAVGMSTVPEAIVARHMNLEVLGISLITNAAAGVVEGSIDHSEVMAMGQQVSGSFIELLQRILKEW
jgi:purine-nucleoside phosphorylase